MQVVILAGGLGTRLWPKSRLKKPKQLQALVSQESMIQNTIRRVLPLASKKKIYIATNQSQLEALKKEVPQITNFIVEPTLRNTGPAIGLAAVSLPEQNEPAAFLPSDHYIADEEGFRETMKLAAQVAERDYLVLIGLRPTDPDSGLGYIKIKKELFEKGNQPVYQVERFIEKPDQKTAQRFLLSDQYLWNAGMFVARPSLILQLFQKHAPQIYQRLRKIQKEPNRLKEEYQKMEEISFDYAVVEKTKQLAVVAGDFSWSDIGNWARLLEILSKKVNANVVIGCEHYGVETDGCLIHGTERLVATVGLKDIIVVDTPDVVLVCHKDKAHDVKKIVDQLKKENKEQYL